MTSTGGGSVLLSQAQMWGRPDCPVRTVCPGRRQVREKVAREGAMTTKGTLCPNFFFFFFFKDRIVLGSGFEVRKLLYPSEH